MVWQFGNLRSGTQEREQRFLNLHLREGRSLWWTSPRWTVHCPVSPMWESVRYLTMRATYTMSSVCNSKLCTFPSLTVHSLLLAGWRKSFRVSTKWLRTAVSLQLSHYTRNYFRTFKITPKIDEVHPDLSRLFECLNTINHFQFRRTFELSNVRQEAQEISR